MTIVDIFHFLGGMCIGLFIGLILGVLLGLRGLR